MTDNTTQADTEGTPTDGPQIDADATEAVEVPDAPGDSEAADSGDTAVAEEPDDTTTTSSLDGKLAAEAARWRVAARQAETRLSVAEAELAELRTAEVENAAEKMNKLADPKDLWLAPGLTVDKLIGDDGKVDIQKVNEAVDELLAAKPHWRKAIGAPASAVNGTGTIPSTGHAAQPSWTDVIRGAAR